jgi:hypothetical protein
MRNLIALVLYIYASILLVSMADAIDLDFHEQSDTIIEPGHDLELDHLNDGYLHASDNVRALMVPGSMMSNSQVLTIDLPDAEID